MIDQPPPEEPHPEPVEERLPEPVEQRRPEPGEGNSVPSTSAIPHNREAEEAVVGAVLINPEVYYDLAQFLQADDFYIHRHRWIWEAFTRLHEKRIPLDFLTVTEELQSAGQLAEIGGPAYLTALLNQVPTSLHAEAYGRMVEAAAIRRRLLHQPIQLPPWHTTSRSRSRTLSRSLRNPSSTSASGGSRKTSSRSLPF